MRDVPIKVLVLDDDESVGDSLADLLDDHGFDVAWAQSGEAALACRSTIFAIPGRPNHRAEKGARTSASFEQLVLPGSPY